MLIALLAILGVDLIVLVAFVASVLARRRWVAGQPGAFRGAIRGDLDGLGPKWKRGYGRWVRDVFVWTKGPLLLRNVLVPADELDVRRPARPDEIKRLGDEPIVIRFKAGEATLEVAAGADDEHLLVTERSMRDATAA